MIKKAGIVLLVSILTLSEALSQDFYDINTINTIEITFAQSNWDYLLDNLASAGDNERLMGGVVINGTLYDSVGVRYKGNSSYSPNRIKNPLNIKLDYLIDGQKYQDYGTIKLANVFKDPSFIRESLSYEIARKYFPASGSNYAKVYINGTYLGLYANDQDVDKHFLKAHIGSGGNVRIKGELGENLPPNAMGGVWEYLGSDSSNYAFKYALESDEGWGELVEFLDTLNHHNDELGNVLNVDRHLWFIAFQNLLVNLDGPINNPQNYYIFKDDLGRFNPIPWDMNECFGVFTNFQSSGNLNAYQLQRLSPFANDSDSDYPIISKVLDNERHRKMYVAHFRTIMAEVFENDWYYTRALEIQDIIAAEVDADPNKFYTYANFIANVTSSVGSSGPPPNASVIGITQLMDTRVDYLNTLAEFSADPPAIVSVADSSLSGSLTVRIIAEVVDANTVQMAYRLSILERFEFVDMFDDGLHDDGAVGDGVYGSTPITPGADMQYYIYAENDLAGVFLPEHAAREFLSIDVNQDLVINELMADNEATMADQDEEYDDWVELYNNSDSEIQLGTYYLSDDGTDLMQWSIPDTLLEPFGFITIWADNDEEQEGLHANFKLSAGGESLFLTTESGVIINEVTFPSQVADLSWGRSLDGIGDFIQMAPTFNRSNEETLAFDEKVDVQPQSMRLSQNYPNPFNGSTTIRYYQPQGAVGVLTIFSVQGEAVFSTPLPSDSEGWQQLSWNGLDRFGNVLPTGVYIAKLQAGTHTKSMKMLLLK
jgi:hypothetical protein